MKATAKRLIEQAGAPGGSAQLMTIGEVAEHCVCCVRHVQNEVKLGHLRVLRLGRLVRVDPADLASYLEARKSGGRS